MNHYETLGVPTNASQSEIEAAFKKQKQAHIPDTHPDFAGEVESLKQIISAYRVLHDPERRKEYDQLLEWQRSPTEIGAISDEEFHSWFEAGKLTEGIAYKLEKAEAERIRREDERARREEKIALAKAAPGCLVMIGRGIWGAVALWDWLDDHGYISHDKLTSVTSNAWAVGEYKDCSSYNVEAEQPSLFCDGFASAPEKVFKVRFYGKTRVEGKPETFSFSWKCEKNSIGGFLGSDVAITCELQKQK